MQWINSLMEVSINDSVVWGKGVKERVEGVRRESA